MSNDSRHGSASSASNSTHDGSTSANSSSSPPLSPFSHQQALPGEPRSFLFGGSDDSSNISRRSFDQESIQSGRSLALAGSMAPTHYVPGTSTQSLGGQSPGSFAQSSSHLGVRNNVGTSPYVSSSQVPAEQRFDNPSPTGLPSAHTFPPALLSHHGHPVTQQTDATSHGTFPTSDQSASFLNMHDSGSNTPGSYLPPSMSPHPSEEGEIRKIRRRSDQPRKENSQWIHKPSRSVGVFGSVAIS